MIGICGGKMIIVVKTSDGKEHKADIPQEYPYIEEDLLRSIENNINPAEMLLELACAGSRAARGEINKCENNRLLKTILD